jgi:two-component system, cell cycle sensor histidine kinase and response regulator CckA
MSLRLLSLGPKLKQWTILASHFSLPKFLIGCLAMQIPHCAWLSILVLIRGGIMRDMNLNGSSKGHSVGLWLRAAVLLVLAMGLSALLLAAWKLQDRLEPLALALGGLFAVCGLLGVLAWISGMLQFAGTTAERPFFDAVADAMGDASLVTDAKGRAVYANAAFLKLASKAGASRLVGMDVLCAGYPDFAEPVYQLAQAALAGETLQRDIRVAAGSSVPGAQPDSSRWLRLGVSPLAGAGHQGFSLWRLLDITTDRQHQESAFSRLQFIITYLDHAPAGFFSTLPNGKVDYVNATLADWLGLDLLEAQGGRLALADVVGTDTAQLLSAMEPVADGFRTERFTVPLTSRKAGRFDVEILHRADFDKDGKALPSRTMVLKRDAALHDISNAHTPIAMQGLGTALPIGFAQLDNQAVIQTANSVFLGLSPKLKLRGKLQQAFANGKAGMLDEAIASATAAPGSRIEFDVVFDNTEPRAIKLYLIQMQAEENLITVFAQDLTESKALEVQLAQSQKMQAVGQLASGIAHDFNNVLTPIIGFADLLLAKMRPTDGAFTDVMNIKQNANRAANLVRQLLAFSRKQTMQPKSHSLTEAMSDLGNLLGRVLGEKVELDISHGRDLGFVMVDIHQFEQVIINLAVNARDAMPQGGKLHVRTYNLAADQVKTIKHSMPEVEYVVCEVADTGSGIAADIVEKIWEPFFSTKDVGKGTGLGLSMVYGIIKQTGGFIFCDSVMGKGTTFSIYLPRHYPEKPAAGAIAPVAEAKPVLREDFTGRGRILVVEDEDSVRAFAVKALQSRGYTVVEAESGEAGLEAIARDKDGFELILSDVVMPEMDGPTMLAEIRKRGITTRFIFMSGYAEDAFERNLENPDDFGFLQKPFSLKQLLEKVKDGMA